VKKAAHAATVCPAALRAPWLLKLRIKNFVQSMHEGHTRRGLKTFTFDVVNSKKTINEEPS
jgi:hypothetical protein